MNYFKKISFGKIKEIDTLKSGISTLDAISIIEDRVSNKEVLNILTRYIKDHHYTDIQFLILQGDKLADTVISIVGEISTITEDTFAEKAQLLLGDGVIQRISHANRNYMDISETDVTKLSTYLKNNQLPLFKSDPMWSAEKDGGWQAEGKWKNRRLEKGRQHLPYDHPVHSNLYQHLMKFDRTSATQTLAFVKSELEEGLSDILNTIKDRTEGVLNTSYRTKTVDSLVEKINRIRKAWPEEGYVIGSSTDLLGGRIVVKDLSSLQEVMQQIETIFGRESIIRKENLYSNPRKNDGYRAIHYILEMPGHPDHCFELQLKTLPSMIASDLFHNTVYKPEILNIPGELSTGAVIPYTWQSVFTELTALKSQSLPQQNKQWDVSVEDKLTDHVQQAIATHNYNQFYDVVLSRLDDDLFQDKERWIAAFDSITTFLNKEVEILMSLPQHVIFRLAQAAHDKGYWNTPSVKGLVEDTSTEQLGWELSAEAFQMLTPKGQTAYNERFEMFGSRGHKLSVDDLDLQALDLEQQVDFFKAAGKTTITTTRVETLTGSEKIMNLYHTHFDQLVKNSKKIQNQASLDSWNEQIVKNQIKAIATSVILSEIGGIDSKGTARDLASPAESSTQGYSIREKLTYYFWSFALQMNDEFGFDGLDRTGQEDPEGWRVKDSQNRCQTCYSEFITHQNFAHLKDIDKPIDHAILKAIVSNQLKSISDKIQASNNAVFIARYLDHKTQIMKRYLGSIIENPEIRNNVIKIYENSTDALIKILLEGELESKRLITITKQTLAQTTVLSVNTLLSHPIYFSHVVDVINRFPQHQGDDWSHSETQLMEKLKEDQVLKNIISLIQTEGGLLKELGVGHTNWESLNSALAGVVKAINNGSDVPVGVRKVIKKSPTGILLADAGHKEIRFRPGNTLYTYNGIDLDGTLLLETWGNGVAEIEESSVIMRSASPITYPEGHTLQGLTVQGTYQPEGTFVIDQDNGKDTLFNEYVTNTSFVESSYGVTPKSSWQSGSKLVVSYAVDIPAIILMTADGKTFEFSPGDCIVIDEKNGQVTSIHGVEHKWMTETYVDHADHMASLEITKTAEDST